MHWNCRPFFAPKRTGAVPAFIFAILAVIVFGAIGCDSEKDERRRQFVLLENALDDISASDDVLWLEKLKIASEIKVEFTEIQKIQTLCISSYREYADAMTKLAKSREQISVLEQAIVSKKIEKIEEKQRNAQKAISETNQHLERAEKYVQQCVIERQKMKKKLGVMGK